jgi:hypothetical protein
MAMIERVFINHHIEVHDKGGRIEIRLIDESCGPGELVDDTAVIEPLNNDFMIPLKSGGFTPASAEEVVYVLSKLPMAVKKYDGYGGNPVIIDHFFLPETDEGRLALITADREEMRAVERELEYGERDTPPEWYTALKRLRESGMRSLFR